MGFTTQIFLFVYFPLCLLGFLAANWSERWGAFGKLVQKLRLKDLLLIGFSLLFYMWACFDDVIKLCLYIAVVWLAGCWIGRSRKKGLHIHIHGSEEGKKLYLAVFCLLLSLTAVIGLLVYYKYTGFLTQIFGWLFATQATARSVLAPLGISFITFSAISYLVDIYRGDAPAGDLIDCALYLSFFPKVVSGPIVLWKDFRTQMGSRKVTLDGFVEGISRIMIGFAKKVLLADQFGAAIANIGTSGIDQLAALGTLLLYMLQIYYDFAGYSDIAIGLAKLFGFNFKENFDFPYRSKSISEFWRRWHISLGTWFREYVYFPLGGSRGGLKTTLRNLAVVFALTGIWHGAGWNYILWGAVNGAFVLLERVIRDRKAYQKTPDWIKYLATMLITMLCWQLFRFPTLRDAVRWMEVIAGLLRFETVAFTWQYYFDARLITFVIVGTLGATVLGSSRLKTWYQKIATNPAVAAVQNLILLVLFVLAIMFMVNSTYSPFIYFQY